jgi:DNA-binding protein HU-beta
MGALTKSQTTSALANKLGISKADAGRYIEAFAGLACDEAKNNGSFTLPGLGKLVLVDRKARQGRNPQTGAVIQIPAKKVVKFRVSKACKDAVLVAPASGGTSW